VLKGNFASSVFNIYDAKTQMARILVTGPQCVNSSYVMDLGHLSAEVNLFDDRAVVLGCINWAWICSMVFTDESNTFQIMEV
jgi:hypothetical protein